MTRFTIDYADTPFLKTSQTSPNVARLNWRCEMLLTRNQQLIRNRRVLDLASHDGRFSYACLQLGAQRVTGIEGRPYLVANARKNMKALGFDEDRFRFESGDIFEWIERFEPASFDVILCFGFLYHTIRQVEFFQQMKRLRPTFLILDSRVERYRGWTYAKLVKFLRRMRRRGLSPRELTRLWRLLDFERGALFFRREDSSKEGSTIEESNLIAVPTVDLLEQLMSANGFELRRIPWERAEIDDILSLREYASGMRVSYVGERARQ